MSEPEKSNHWESLAEQLGIEAREVHRPQQSAATPPPLIKKAGGAVRKPASTGGDWDQLARSLGIDVPPRPPRVQPDEARQAVPPVPEAVPARAEVVKPAKEAERGGEERVRRERGRERGREGGRQTERAGAEEGRRRGRDGGRSRGERAAAEPARSPGLSAERLADGEHVAGEEEPAERRKRRRRRRRKRSGQAATPAVQPSEAGQPLDDEEDRTELEFAERAEEVWEDTEEMAARPAPEIKGPDESAPHKRRGRRRGRRRTERTVDAQTAEPAGTDRHWEPDEQPVEDIERGDLPAAHAAPAAEAGTAPPAAAHTEIGEPADAEDQADDRRPVYRGIPTWEEAVGYIIQQNMEARARSPHSGGSRSRSGRDRGHGT
jgi:hypothetical protein